MKKIIAIMLIVVLCGCLFSGCNQGFGVGSLKFNGIHFQIHDNYADAFVHKWYENETGIEVNTKEYGSMFLSEGTYILYNDICPLCGG